MRTRFPPGATRSGSHPERAEGQTDDKNATVQEVEVPTRFLRRPEVTARTGLSRSTIYVRVADGSFPKPVSWIEEEVDEWIRQQIAASRGDTE